MHEVTFLFLRFNMLCKVPTSDSTLIFYIETSTEHSGSASLCIFVQLSIACLQSSHQVGDHKSSRPVGIPSQPTSFEGGRPALPVRSQWGSRPSSITGISRDVLDRVLDEPDLPDGKASSMKYFSRMSRGRFCSQ